MMSWKRFRNLICDSKYICGRHQWLEEHFGFDNHLNHIGGDDLYMTIIERQSIDTNKTFDISFAEELDAKVLRDIALSN